MKIAVLVSGGVDSSVALRLLHDQGHDITAFYLKIWLEDELAYLGDCPWEEDLEYVRAVCAQINVPLEVMPLQRAYWDRVVSYTIAEIKAGRTPNPDIMCNLQVKFGAFYDAIGDRFEKIATGHYAQVSYSAEASKDGAERDGLFHLLCAPDPVKDQTYFLSQLTQQQLSKALFPIGHLAKPEVRALAQRYDLPNKDRKDSQGICFLGKLKFREFVEHHVGTNKGPLVEFETHKVVGEHDGFWFYTIGQRQGIGLSGGPWYVVAKDPVKNIIFISTKYHEDDKPRDQFNVAAVNWITGYEPNKSGVEVKMRHGPKKYTCRLGKGAHGSDVWHVHLNEHDQGIAPGQFAVFYDGEECLGGGVIV